MIRPTPLRLLLAAGAFLLTAGIAAGTATRLDAQTLFGVAWDDASGGPVSRASVMVLTLEGTEIEGRGAVADASGRFTLNLTGLEPPFLLVAQKPGFASSAPLPIGEEDVAHPLEVLLELRSLQGEVGISLSEAGVNPDDRTARVLGWVRERDTGRPIVTAEVTELLTGLSATTDVNGMFVLDGLAPGEVSIGVTHLSFAPEGHLFRALPGHTYEIRATMAPDAIPVEGIEVSVQSSTWYRQMDGLRVRMRQGLRGDFVTAAEIERRGYPPPEEAIRGLAGVRIIKTGPHDVDLRFRACEQQPVVYIDGVQVNQPELGEPLRELRMVHGMDIEAIEVYRGAASVPPEFAGPDAMCGALVIWTRR